MSNIDELVLAKTAAVSVRKEAREKTGELLSVEDESGDGLREIVYVDGREADRQYLQIMFNSRIGDGSILVASMTEMKQDEEIVSSVKISAVSSQAVDGKYWCRTILYSESLGGEKKDRYAGQLATILEREEVDAAHKNGLVLFEEELPERINVEATIGRLLGMIESGSFLEQSSAEGDIEQGFPLPYASIRNLLIWE